MMKKVLYVAAAALMLVACDSKTRVVAQWEGNAPKKMKFSVGEKMDTTVAVKDGKLEVKLPADLTSLSRARAGAANFTFVSDGSKLTVNTKTGTIVSSKKNGLHSRYEAYTQWKKDFMNDYYAKIGKMEDGSAEAVAFFNESKEKYNAYVVKTLKANKNNILGGIAAVDLALEDPDDILALISTLSPQIQNLQSVIDVKEACEDYKAGNVQ